MSSKLVLEKLLPHYKEQYGHEAEAVLLGLLSKPKKHELKNPFADLGLRESYLLDEASLLPSMAFRLKEGDRVLDMCSSPGGKLLSLLFLGINDVNYWANDVSKSRYYRLKRVIGEYVPKDFIENYINITCQDAIRFGIKYPNYFDAILLDAPCSSEGHLVEDEKLLSNFKGLSKTLPKRQYGLLCSALLSLKGGGHLVYSTCSINKLENDGVMEKFLAKKGQDLELLDLEFALGRKTEYGLEVLPHLHGAGPFYLAVFRKKF